MPNPIITATTARVRGKRLTKAFLWLCTIVFALQLIVSFSHNHDGHDELADCVTCQVSSQVTGVLPAAAPELLAIFLVIAYLAARRPEYVSVVARSYLIPPRQAPPAHFPL